MVLVSVIIPTYNRAHVLSRAVDSVLAQTFLDWELLIIDDGSTDNTQKIIKSKYIHHNQIHYYYQANQGVSSARNTGIHHAKGLWIALLDSDDKWLPNKLTEQLSFIQRNPNYKLCHTDEIWIRHGIQVNPMKKHEKKRWKNIL